MRSQLKSHYSLARLPSYTDRVLYKSLPRFRDHIRPVYFDSCEDVLTYRMLAAP